MFTSVTPHPVIPADRDRSALARLWHQLGPDIYPLAAVLAVTLHDGVGQCLGEHDPEPKACLGCGFLPRETMTGDELHGLFDAVYIAGKTEGHQCCRTAGPNCRAPANADAER